MKQNKVYQQVGVAMTSRSLAEYERMFDLQTALLAGKRVLDVAGGASSFTAEANAAGIEARAADPLYKEPVELIARHGAAEIETVAAKMEQLTDVYNWEYYGSVADHKAGRIRSLAKFVADYAEAGETGRYAAAALPSLPYADGTFDMALCSHFLFLYGEQFDYAFHRNAVFELLRVCKSGGEVRIYPLLTFQTAEYSHMEELLAELRTAGCAVERKLSKLPFLPNSTHYLHIRKPI